MTPYGEEMTAPFHLASTIVPDMATASITERTLGDVIATLATWETIAP